MWLDFVSRELLKSGELTQLIADDGLRGVTSNPSIFEKAIGDGDDYDELIAAAQQNGDLDPGAFFEELAVRDIQEAADVLRPVYHRTQGRDGYRQPRSVALPGACTRRRRSRRRAGCGARSGART